MAVRPGASAPSSRSSHPESVPAPRVPSAEPAPSALPSREPSAKPVPSALPPGELSAEAGPPSGPGAGQGAGRPRITELRLSAFAGHRGAGIPLGAFTLLTGPSGCGKSTALRAYEALARLGGGGGLYDVFTEPEAYVPDWARPDAQRRRGFRIGCTADGPEGPVRLDVAVQAEPELRIVGERLSADGVVLLQTALRDPSRPVVQAAWHTAGSAPVTRAPLPDDRLGTALLPLRVAGKTDGQRRVLAAAEQMVVALRSVFACDPDPGRMREPVPIGSGRLLPGCANLAGVLWRTRAECGQRHARYVAAVRAACAGPVLDVVAEPEGRARVRGLLERGDGLRTDFARLGDGELRHLALTLVLLTGPGVLDVDAPGEVPSALQALTVLADGFDRALDPRQRAELARLAVRMAGHGHIRCVGTVSDASWAAGMPGVTVVHLDR